MAAQGASKRWRRHTWKSTWKCIIQSGEFKFFDQQMEQYKQGLNQAQAKLTDFTKGTGVVSADSNATLHYSKPTTSTPLHVRPRRLCLKLNNVSVLSRLNCSPSSQE